MADTSIKVYLGIAVSSGTAISGATVVTGDYRNTAVSSLPTTYIKVADITNFPDLIADSEDIESTTMSDTQRTYERGLDGAPTDSFTAQFDRETYEAIQDLVSDNGRNAKYRFCLLISDSMSVFDWVGSIGVGLGGAGINEIISMPISVTFSTPVTLRTGYNGRFENNTISINPKS